MSRLHSLWRYLLPIVLVAIAAGAAVALTQGSASAAPGTLGSLLIDPPSGSDIDGFSVSTVSAGSAKGCPAAATNVTGKITGPGGWAAGFVAFNNNSAAVSSTDEFAVPMSNSMRVIAANNNVQLLAGDYEITMTCQNPLGTSTYGTFVGSLTFTTPTQYTSAGATPGPSTSSSPTTAPSATPSAPSSSTPPSTAPASASPTVAASGIPSPSASGSLPSSPTPTGAAPSGSPTVSPTSTLGTVTFTPVVGTDIDPIQVYVVSSGTAKGCPVGSTNVTGRLVGPGEWARGVVAFTNTSSEVSTSADFSIPLSNSFKVIAANNSLTLVAGRYDITVTCQNALGTQRFGSFTGSLWFTDATHYQANDPANSATQTQTTFTAAPQFRADLAAAVVLTATLNPATATGSLQFRDNINNSFSPVGASTAVTSGTAGIQISTLAFGLHKLSAVFTPATGTLFTASTSSQFVYVVAKPIPPLPPTTAVVTGAARVGSTLRCVATFRNATSVGFAWLRDRATIAGAASSSYRLGAADRGTGVRCRAFATNAGGTTSRTSAAVKAT